MRVFASLVLALALVAPAWADPQDDMSAADKKAFDTYLHSSAFAGRMSDLLKSAVESYFGGCGNVTPGAPNFMVVKPVKSGSDGNPIEGVWKVFFPAEGCGTARIVNAFFVVGKENKLFFLLAVPGTSGGDPQLQKDTVLYALMATARKNMECKKPKIVNSRYDAEETLSEGDKTSPPFKALQIGRQWREIWTVDSCQRFFEVKIHYMKNAMGTNIRAAEDEVVEVNKEQAAKQ